MTLLIGQCRMNWLIVMSQVPCLPLSHYFHRKRIKRRFRSVGIPLAHVRIHKVFYPCNRCHLARLLENQHVTCGNEVTRVTTNGDFALNIHSTQRYRGTEFLLFLRISVSPCLPRYCMWVAKPRASRVGGAASRGRRCRLRGSKVPPPWVEGAAFKS